MIAIGNQVEEQLRSLHDAGDIQRTATIGLEAYGPEVLSFLYALATSEQLALEAFSLFCEDLWRGLPNFVWRSSFRTWAFVIARRAGLRTAQDRYGRRRQTLLSHDAAQVEQAIRTRTLPYLRTTVKDEVQTLRDQMSKDDQTLLMLRVDRGLAWPDIACIMVPDGQQLTEAELARSAVALRKRFQRLKGRLRKLAEASGLLDRYGS